MWQGRGLNVVTLTWINNDGIGATNIVGMIPAVKAEPVVGTNDEVQLAVGPLGAHALKRVPHIRGAWQGKFKIRSHQLWVWRQRLAHQQQPFIVGQQLQLHFKRVLRRHHKPYLVKLGLLQQVSSQRDMSVVYRVKRASVDARLYFSVHGGVRQLYIQKLAHNGQRLGLGLVEVVVHHYTVKLRSKGKLV